VWRGAVSNAVDLSLNLERSEKNIQKFAEKLLKNYPPNAPRNDRQRELNDKRHRNLHAARCFTCPQVVHSTH
jgi:hypothetical protein